jgi:YggT family protein
MMGDALLFVVDVVFRLAGLAILVRVLISWLPMAGMRIDMYHPAIRLLYQITDPILNPIRRFATIGMIDLSPIVALFLLEIIRRLLVTALVGSF